MNIKRLVKRLLCPLQCLRFGIKNQEGNLYIGKACKIVNAKAMRFGKNVSIMPYTMLLCHEGGHLEIGEGAEIGMFSRVASQGEVSLGRTYFRVRIFLLRIIITSIEMLKDQSKTKETL